MICDKCKKENKCFETPGQLATSTKIPDREKVKFIPIKKICMSCINEIQNKFNIYKDVSGISIRADKEQLNLKPYVDPVERIKILDSEIERLELDIKNEKDGLTPEMAMILALEFMGLGEKTRSLDDKKKELKELKNAS